MKCLDSTIEKLLELEAQNSNDKSLFLLLFYSSFYGWVMDGKQDEII